MSDAGEVEDNVAASEVNLSDEHVKLLDEVSALPPEYPGWMIEWQNQKPRVPPAKR